MKVKKLVDMNFILFLYTTRKSVKKTNISVDLAALTSSFDSLHECEPPCSAVEMYYGSSDPDPKEMYSLFFQDVCGAREQQLDD